MTESIRYIFFSILKKGVFFGELCICIPYLSRRPGRRRAGSSVSGRLVAMIIFTYKYMCSFNKNIMAMLSILQVCEDERECGVRGCINSSHIKKWFEIKEESSSVVCSSHSQRSEAKELYTMSRKDVHWDYVSFLSSKCLSFTKGIIPC